jgi:hypothetical protein
MAGVLVAQVDEAVGSNLPAPPPAARGAAGATVATHLQRQHASHKTTAASTWSKGFSQQWASLIGACVYLSSKTGHFGLFVVACGLPHGDALARQPARRVQRLFELSVIVCASADISCMQRRVQSQGASKMTQNRFNQQVPPQARAADCRSRL